MAENDDDGFGLVEIVVSMFLILIIAVAFLPALITSMQASVRNTTISTAVQLLNSELEDARRQPELCPSLVNWATAAGTTVEDPQSGNARPWLRSTRAAFDSRTATQLTSASQCPAGTELPTTIRVTVTVRPASQESGGSLGEAISSASTLLYVGAP